MKYSAIVEIAERVSRLERNLSGYEDPYLKLHRGVMDVCDINTSNIDVEITKDILRYGNNDGDKNLINLINDQFVTNKHKTIIVPGGMSSIDILIESLSDSEFWIPKYHWSSWSEILKKNNKRIRIFDDFNLSKTTIESGVVMLCFPSNPTGWMPKLDEIFNFIKKCYKLGITVILDLPYYNLFFDNFEITKMFFDNVIIASSFSKSIGMSGIRVGFVSTLNDDLYNVLRIRSLYKYNTISNISQNLILKTLKNEKNVNSFREETKSHIKENIDFLSKNNLLFDEYPNLPTGPFAIIKPSYEDLLNHKISSVPLDSFMIEPNESNKNLSRISVAVNSITFKHYFFKYLNHGK